MKQERLWKYCMMLTSMKAEETRVGLLLFRDTRPGGEEVGIVLTISGP